MTERVALMAQDRIAPDTFGIDETPHAFLRRVTRPWHDGVEEAFAPFDLATRDGLAAFLLRQAAALFPLERALERAGIEAQLGDWPERRRARALAEDLAGLGLEVPAGPELPDLKARFETLGAAYVLEGSKLGGRVLHRRVLASPDPQVRAAVRFLGHRHERGWPSFLVLLDAAPRDAGTREALRAGARLAFSAFAAAAGRDAAARLADAPTRSGHYAQLHA